MITKARMKAWVHRHCKFVRHAMQGIPQALMDEHGMPKPASDIGSLANEVARKVADEFPGARAYSQHQIESMISRVMEGHGLKPLPSGSEEKRRLIRKVFDILDAAHERSDPEVRRPAWAA